MQNSRVVVRFALCAMMVVSTLAVAGSKTRLGLLCGASLVGTMHSQFFPVEPKFPEPRELRKSGVMSGTPSDRAYAIRSWYEAPSSPGMEVLANAFAPFVTLMDALTPLHEGASLPEALRLSLSKHFSQLLTYSSFVTSLIFFRRLLSTVPVKDFLKLAEDHLEPPTRVLYLSSISPNSPLKGYAENDFQKRFGSDPNVEATYLAFENINRMRDALEGLPQFSQFDRIELITDERSSADTLHFADGTGGTVDNFDYFLAKARLAIAAPGAQLIVWSSNSAALPNREMDGYQPHTLAQALGKWLLGKGGKVIACPRRLKIFERVLTANSYQDLQSRRARMGKAFEQALVYLFFGIPFESVRFVRDFFGQDYIEALKEIAVFEIRPGRGPSDFTDQILLDPNPPPSAHEIWPIVLKPRPKSKLESVDSLTVF